MGLNDLTSQSVQAAIVEYDRLGRDTFLDRYGFGRAKAYFLDLNGNHYDSKAIAGAAHGFLDGALPLGPHEFSGGEQTVARLLTKLGFSVINTQSRNPNWTRDELILTLDFYFRHHDGLPNHSSDQIADLSSVLNRLAQRLGVSGGETFRNQNGVYMKLMNFRRLDPSYIESGKLGLQRGAKSEELVWAEFAHDIGRLTRTAEAIRRTIDQTSHGQHQNEDLELPEPDFVEAPEGRLLTYFHKRRERNQKLVAKKKNTFLGEHGRLFCEACGFDFRERYGEWGDGFIECHHTRPVHTLREGDKTRLQDLKLLCANCHRMVHAKSPWLDFEDLVRLLE